MTTAFQFFEYGGAGPGDYEIILGFEKTEPNGPIVHVKQGQPDASTILSSHSVSGTYAIPMTVNGLILAMQPGAQGLPVKVTWMVTGP